MGIIVLYKGLINVGHFWDPGFAMTTLTYSPNSILTT